jgi:hypothetical protein
MCPFAREIGRSARMRRYSLSGILRQPFRLGSGDFPAVSLGMYITGGPDSQRTEAWDVTAGIRSSLAKR